MNNRNWLNSDSRQRRLFGIGITQYKLRAIQRGAIFACVLMLMLAVTLLQGCATKLPTTCVLPEPTPLPALTQPIPSESYSEQWRKLVQSLRLRQIDTQTTQKP